jgi:hypothetical protein
MNLLDEAMGLAAAPAKRRAPAAASSSRAPPPRQVGRPLARNALPLDLGLKRGCVVTSPEALGWAAQREPLALDAVHCSAAAAGGLGEATGAPAEDCDGADLCLRLARALTHWRHPARLLPATVVRQLVSSAAAPAPTAAEKPDAEYAATLRGEWEAALRSLYYALRAGRCPYFYCRHDETYSLVWRNAALPLGANAAGVGGAAHGGRPLQADSSGCYAVLAPSTGALRAQLDAAGVPYEMPCRDDGGGGGGGGRGGGGGGGGRGARGGGGGFGGGGGAAAGGGDAAAPTDREGAAELAALNAHNERAPLPPRSADGVGGDAGRRSALLFAGHDSLHALYDWMLNQKVQAVLSTQLLAPQPFLHGAPRAARVHCWRATAGVGTSAAGNAMSGPLETMRVEAEDAREGLLPGALHQLCDVLRVSQHGEFELCAMHDRDASAWLNVPPPDAAARAARGSPQLPQPLARVSAPADDDADGGAAAAPTTHQVVERVVCTGGQLHLLPPQ